MESVKHSRFRESIHSDSHTKIRRLLKNKRQSLGLSQRCLAKKLLVTYSFISKVETGDRRLDIVELKRYADMLELKMGDIFQLLESPPPSPQTPKITTVKSSYACVFSGLYDLFFWHSTT